MQIATRCAAEATATVPPVVSLLAEHLIYIVRFALAAAAVYVKLVDSPQEGRLISHASARIAQVFHAAYVMRVDSRREGRSNLIAPVCTLPWQALEPWATAKLAGTLLLVRRPSLVQVATAGHADTAQRVDTPLEQAPGI